MTFDARIVHVMIASPSDTIDERNIFREVIGEWNAINAFNTKTMLLPISWELDVAPELGLHPQDLINNRILDRTDILVATFWSRIGSPTKKARSGAVEEIELHLKRKKPVLLYFSNREIKLKETHEKQVVDLRNFKKWASKKGLYREYDSTKEFSSLLLRHLHMVLVSSGFLYDAGFPKPVAVASPLDSMKLFSRNLLSSLASSSTLRATVHRVSGTFVIKIDHNTIFASEDIQEYTIWIDQIVALLGQNYLRDPTGRGEIFYLTDIGRTVGGAHKDP